MIELTAETVKQNDIDQVRLLASPTTIWSGLYVDALRAKNVAVIAPDDSKFTELEIHIREVIGGGQPPALLIPPTGPPTILGCTELSISEKKRPNTIDPLQIVADRLLDGYNGAQDD